MYPKVKYTEERKEEIINTYHERASMRGIQRIFGTAPATLSGWLKKSQTPIISHLLPAKPDDILELDEMWTFVQKRENKQWLWLALYRRTKQIVGYYLGDRDIKACQAFKANIAPAYQNLITKSDMWKAYNKTFDSRLHECS